MSTQDPLAVYSLWAASSAIMEEPSDQDTDATPKYSPSKGKGRKEREVKSDGRQERRERLRDSNGNAVKQSNRRARIVLSDSGDEGPVRVFGLSSFP